MISIAITGGIGSGKSFVAGLLQERGIPVYNTDNEAKRLMLTDAGIRKELTELLGNEVYCNGVLNKSLLASYLFADAKHAANINSIVHPRVRADFSQWLLSHENEEIVGLECAILYESGFDDMTDFVVMVYAPESLRIERAMKRDGATKQQVKARIDAQMSDEEKCEKAHFIIYNDGSDSLDEQLMKLIKQFKTSK